MAPWTRACPVQAPSSSSPSADETIRFAAWAWGREMERAGAPMWAPQEGGTPAPEDEDRYVGRDGTTSPTGGGHAQRGGRGAGGAAWNAPAARAPPQHGLPPGTRDAGEANWDAASVALAGATRAPRASMLTHVTIIIAAPHGPGWQVLIQRRAAADALCPTMWECVGGKALPGIDMEEVAMDALARQLGIRVGRAVLELGTVFFGAIGRVTGGAWCERQHDGHDLAVAAWVLLARSMDDVRYELRGGQLDATWCDAEALQGLHDAVHVCAPVFARAPLILERLVERMARRGPSDGVPAASAPRVNAAG